MASRRRIPRRRGHRLSWLRRCKICGVQYPAGAYAYHRLGWWHQEKAAAR